MQKIFKSMLSAIQSHKDDTPKPPMHVGEVMSCWTAYAIFREAQIFYKMALNTTEDKPLKNITQEIFDGSVEDWNKLRDFLIKEGVQLPATSQAKPDSTSSEIPPGVKLTDDEIANGIALKLAAVNMLCASSISQSTRTDIGLMFLKVQANILMYSAELKTLMEKRSWLKTPPYYLPPGAPKQKP
ncbi:DUF3231 family protein [Pseudalkalibacillus hwajinpoensis]|uniref:DUF3231 family protein n=1 Tax=Guptibacillus hwajinpoensis TaxID=208199 RepID=A0A4U1MFM9_9BACL|nr:DUF3231 family protein [Pseudalkalibacillus hwajinpoensis]TKD69172.1 DUF3231 family protein [Pseudalkalibacillus hwajinpoensis]